jgi:hypothetical protein
VKDRDEGKQKNVTQQRVASVSLPAMKYFKKNSIGGMRAVTVAPAGTQMRV